MSLQSNIVFAVREPFTSARWPTDTFAITNQFELDQVLEIPSATSIVLKNSVQIERMEITATGGVATIVKRGLTQEWDSVIEDIALRKDWGDWDLCYITSLAFDQIQLDWTNTFTGNNTFEWTQSFEDIAFTNTTTGGLKVKSLTTTERDAISNASNGMIIYNTTDWVNNQYIWGVWSTFASWAVVNASTTVSGKVELPTDAEVTAKTVTGWTGATLTPTNEQTAKSVALKVVNGTMAESDHIVFDKWGTDNKMTKSTLREQLSATNTLKGTVERATDPEATAWTDTTRYITAKQAKDNYAIATNIVTLDLVFVDSAQSNINIAHWLGKIPRYINATIGRAATAYNNDIQAWSASYDWVTIVQKTHEDNWTEAYDDVLFFYTNSNSNYWAWEIVSIDSTNITLSYTDVWTAPTDTIKVKIDFIG